MNKTCVVGCVGLEWTSKYVMLAHDLVGSGEPILVQNGDTVTIDGSTGNVWFHKNVAIDQGSLSKKASELLSLINKHKGAPPVVMEATSAEDFGVVPWGDNQTVIYRTAILEKETGATRIVDLMKHVQATSKQGVVIVDVSLYETYDMESMFLYTMTSSDNQEHFKARVLAVCSGIVSSGVPCLVKTNHFEEEIKAQFPTISLVPRVSSISGLLSCDSVSLVTVDDKTINEVFEGPAVFKKLADLVGVTTLATSIHWFRVLE